MNFPQPSVGSADLAWLREKLVLDAEAAGPIWEFSTARKLAVVAPAPLMVITPPAKTMSARSTMARRHRPSHCALSRSNARGGSASGFSNHCREVLPTTPARRRR